MQHQQTTSCSCNQMEHKMTNTGGCTMPAVANQTLRKNSVFSSLPPGVRFSLRGMTYQNNSLVTLENIDEGDDNNPLLCLTNLTACCRGGDTPVGTGPLGNWFFPNGTAVPNMIIGVDIIWEFYRNRGPSVVRMHRRRGGVNGIYRCVIPDTTGVNQTIYIGAYTAGSGELYMYTRVN